MILKMTMVEKMIPSELETTRKIHSIEWANFKASLRIREKIELYLNGSLKMKGEGNFYYFYCPDHGIQLSKPQGYYDLLVCVECLEETAREREAEREAQSIIHQKTLSPIGESGFCANRQGKPTIERSK